MSTEKLGTVINNMPTEKSTWDKQVADAARAGGDAYFHGMYFDEGMV